MPDAAQSGATPVAANQLCSRDAGRSPRVAGFADQRLEDYDARIDAVTIADLASFARRYFQKQGRTQLTIRP